MPSAWRVKRQLSPLRYSLCTFPFKNTLHRVSHAPCRLARAHQFSAAESRVSTSERDMEQRTTEDLLRGSHETRLGVRRAVKDLARVVRRRRDHDEAGEERSVAARLFRARYAHVEDPGAAWSAWRATGGQKRTRRRTRAWPRLHESVSSTRSGSARTSLVGLHGRVHALGKLADDGLGR